MVTVGVARHCTCTFAAPLAVRTGELPAISPAARQRCHSAGVALHRAVFKSPTDAPLPKAPNAPFADTSRSGVMVRQAGVRETTESPEPPAKRTVPRPS